MRKQSKLLSTVVFFLIASLIIAGCWNRRELNTLAIVAGAAIDKGQKPDEIQLTVQVIKPGEMKGPGKDGNGAAPQEAFQNLKEKGTSGFQIIRSITQEYSRKPYWPHSQILIFSEEVAKEGIRKHLDLFLRDHEPRPLTNILIAKGSAAAILEQKSGQEKIPALGIYDTIKTLSSSSIAPQINILEMTKRLLSKPTAPIAPLIELVGEGKDRRARITGTAIFKGDRLVGELNGSESRGLLWVINEVKSGIISVDYPEGKEKVDLEIIRASSKIIPEIKDGKIRIVVKIREEGNLGAQMSSENLTKAPAWKKLEEKQGTAIGQEVTAALQKARELNTDIFGFGNAIQKKFPKIWNDLEKNWDNIFPGLEVVVTVEAKLRRSGLISKPAIPE